MHGSRHQHLFKENVKKTKRGLRILKRMVQELSVHREGISTSIIFIFLFYIFFIFFWVDKGVALGPTYPQVR